VVLFGDPDELLDRLGFEIGNLRAARLVEEFQGGRVGGIHLNAFTRQPFALVALADGWSVAASHEILELLADPSGNRLIAAAHPMDANERVRYLVEICDPCQTIWYPVNGVQVSDFYTPRYFDPVRNPGLAYSFTGTLERPLEVVDGGYITWIGPRDMGLYQLRGGDDEPVLLEDISSLARTSAPLRTIVDGNPASPRVTADSLVAAHSATAPAGSAQAVREAAEGSAVRVAEAFLSLVAEADAEAWR
jgi:hypothetical protein